MANDKPEKPTEKPKPTSTVPPGVLEPELDARFDQPPKTATLQGRPAAPKKPASGKTARLGDIVYYRVNGESHPAIVVHVAEDGRLHLRAFSSHGEDYRRNFVSEGDDDETWSAEPLVPPAPPTG